MTMATAGLDRHYGAEQQTEYGDRSLVYAIVIAFISQLLDCEVAQKAIAVRGLLIFALLVHKPNAVKAILAAVVANAKLATDFLTPFSRCAISVDETNS